MTRVKHPLLPTSVRSTFWLIRTFGVVIALGEFAAAGLAAPVGRRNWRQDLPVPILRVRPLASNRTRTEAARRRKIGL